MSSLLTERDHAELDALCLSLLECAAQYRAVRGALDTELAEGFLYLSQARKSMGFKNITPTQFPPEMTATLCVGPDSDSGADANTNTSDTLEMALPAPSADSTETGLRHRRAQRPPATEADPAVGAGAGATPAAAIPSEKKPQDPLRWFGVFVPAPLRSAQGRFRDVAEKVVHLANLQARMAEIEARRSSLLMSK